MRGLSTCKGTCGLDCGMSAFDVLITHVLTEVCPFQRGALRSIFGVLPALDHNALGAPFALPSTFERDVHNDLIIA